MSQENVEILNRQIDAFNRGDRTAWLAPLAEDFEITPIGDWPDARSIRGGEAGWQFYRDIAETLSIERTHVQYVDAGGDKVVGHARHEVRGQASGADVELDYWTVVTFQEGKITRNEWFTDRTEALEAAGRTE